MAGRLNTANLIERARKEVWTSLLGLMPAQEAIIKSPHVMENERYLAAARLGLLEAIAEDLNSTDSEIEVDPADIEELRASLRPAKSRRKPAIRLVKSA